MSTKYITSSDLKSADAAIVTQSGVLYGVTLMPGSSDSSVVLYDNASAASGVVLAKVTCLANTKSDAVIFNQPIAFNNGVYADVTGTSAAYIVYYATS